MAAASQGSISTPANDLSPFNVPPLSNSAGNMSAASDPTPPAARLSGIASGTTDTNSGMLPNFGPPGALADASGTATSVDAAGAAVFAAASGNTAPGTASALSGPSSAGSPGDPRAEFVKAWSEAQQMLAQNRLADALLLLSEWVTDSRLPAADHDRLMDLLDQLGGTVVYSREHALEAPYVVQPGDTLESIAAKCEIPWQLLGKINGIADPLQVRPGDQLKIIRGPFDALVELHNYQLTLFLHSRYAGRFRIGVGQDQQLPEGEFVVRQKMLNPPYFPPGQQSPPVAPNDPSNPLGGRYIDLGNGIGIHGTNDPSSIGHTGARGSIRLGPTDIVDLYDILSLGSGIAIRR
jgi:lipoprotein-anchoring transpeptidase ErfK/SrfK